MPIVNKIINQAAKVQSEVNMSFKLKTGTQLQLLKGNLSKDIIVTRTNNNGRIFKTVYSINNKIPKIKSCEEFLRYGLFNINFIKDGRKKLTLRIANGSGGRKNIAKNGFLYMSKEETILQKSDIIKNGTIIYSPNNKNRKYDTHIIQWLTQLRKGKPIYQEYWLSPPKTV